MTVPEGDTVALALDPGTKGSSKSVSDKAEALQDLGCSLRSEARGLPRLAVLPRWLPCYSGSGLPRVSGASQTQAMPTR